MKQKPEETVAVTELPQGGKVTTTAQDALLAEMLADAGVGLENVTAKDMAIPFLKLLQTSTPAAKEDDGAYVEGAKPGMFLNTVTMELYDAREPKGAFIIFIPVHFEKLIVEWDANQRGRIVNRYPLASDVLAKAVANDKGKPCMPGTMNPLEETAYHFGLVVKENSNLDWGVLALKSTGLKHSKRWVSLMKGARKVHNGVKFEPASYALQYKISTWLDKRGDDSWYSYKIEPAGDVTDPNIYAAAKAFNKAIHAGTAKMSDNEGDAADGPNPEDIPF